MNIALIHPSSFILHPSSFILHPSSFRLYSAPMLDVLNQAVTFVRGRTKIQPHAGIVLGSGLGDVVQSIKVEASIPYGEIPGAKAASVVGHAGNMVFGHVGRLPVVALAGRMHFYEGYEMAEVMHLSRIAARLGI